MIDHTVQSWVGSVDGQEELYGPRMASVMLTDKLTRCWGGGGG